MAGDRLVVVGARADDGGYSLVALDSEGAVDFEPTFKTTTLRALGIDQFYQYADERPVPNRDILAVLQPLYQAKREDDSVVRAELIEDTGLDADYIDRIIWMLHDQGVFAGNLYISGPGTGAVDVYGEASGDGWWIDAVLTDHGRQLFEELR